MNKYILILGQSSDLCKQELVSLFANGVEYLGSNFALINNDSDPRELIDSLGGTIKIATYLERFDKVAEITPEKCYQYLEPYLNANKKNNFGFSYYDASPNLRQSLERLAMSVKKELKNNNYKARLVTSRAHELSSVIVTKENLINTELIFISDHQSIIVGRTVAVQDFVRYGQRDFARPQRDDRSGMLPPKLAQMMINLGGADRYRTLLDPFCGSGTILQEALLLDYTEVLGSDLSPQAVSASQKNISWLKKNFGLSNEAKIIQQDVRHLAESLDENSVDLIVTEPFMGPAQWIQRQNSVSDLYSIAKELTELYQAAFENFYQVLKPGAIVVFAFPIFSIHGEKLATLAADQIASIGFSPILPAIKSDKLSVNGNIIYSRPEQKVIREISIWQKD